MIINTEVRRVLDAEKLIAALKVIQSDGWWSNIWRSDTYKSDSFVFTVEAYIKFIYDAEREKNWESCKRVKIHLNIPKNKGEKIYPIGTEDTVLTGVWDKTLNSELEGIYAEAKRITSKREAIEKAKVDAVDKQVADYFEGLEDNAE